MVKPLVIHLYSAGIDSFIGYHHLIDLYGEENVKPVYFALKHKYQYAEIHTIRKLFSNDKIHIADIVNLGVFERDDAHIPFRNIILILLASSMVSRYKNRPIKIAINSMYDDSVSDQGEEFIKDMNGLIKQHLPECDIEVISSMPYEWTKFDAIDWYKHKYFGDVWKLEEYTFSCYQPILGLTHCNSCPACFRRNTALYYAGIERPFYNKELIKEYKEKALNNKYPQKRNKAILDYVRYLTEGT